MHGPMWERDLAPSTSAISALRKYQSYVECKGAPALPPASDELPPMPKRQRSSGSRGPTVEERLKPLVEMLRELEERERRSASPARARPVGSGRALDLWQERVPGEDGPPLTSMFAAAEAAAAHDSTPIDVLIQRVLQSVDVSGNVSGSVGFGSIGGQRLQPWRCLGLEPGASRPLIRKRFLSMALRLHVRVTPSPQTCMIRGYRCPLPDTHAHECSRFLPVCRCRDLRCPQPDKTSHPRAREAFTIMDRAFRDLTEK